MVRNYKRLKKGDPLYREFVDEDVLSLSLARMRTAFELFDTIVVSFSGGKDSTAALLVTLQVAHELGRLPVEVMFMDEEAIGQPTVDYVRRVAERPDVRMKWVCLPVKHRNACSDRQPHWYPWHPDEEEKWVRPMPENLPDGCELVTLADCPWFRVGVEDTITANTKLYAPEKYGMVGRVLGIRAQESPMRRWSVSRKVQDNFITDRTSHMAKVNPIYDWMTDDVWTHIRNEGADYNETYDLFEKLGIGHSSQRVAPPFGEQPMQMLWVHQLCWPEQWDKMVSRVPGAHTASMYSKTELYSFGKTVQPQKGETYKGLIRRILDGHDESIRHLVAGRVRHLINHHYARTSDPLAPTCIHPETGTSWSVITNIAARGDLKHRSQPQMKVAQVQRGSDRYKQIWNSYVAQLREVAKDPVAAGIEEADACAVRTLLAGLNDSPSRP